MPQHGEVKSKSPRRWMAALLVALAVGAVVLALVWTTQSGAQAAADIEIAPAGLKVLAKDQVAEGWSASDLKCEMVRLWPLPHECLFVFSGEVAKAGPARGW